MVRLNQHPARDWQQHLALRIQRGEPAALEELYDRAAARVYRAAVVMTGSEPVGEDITRAVFLEVWRHPGSLPEHQDQLFEYLTELVCHRAAFWRVHHRAARPVATTSPGGSEP